MDELVRAIPPGYELPVDGIHGPAHWARVQRMGLKLAKASPGADQEMVKLFAVLHDSRRLNEKWDPGHGLRGAELARSLRGTLVHLDDAQFNLLFETCRDHTDGETTTDPTIGCCWDADRLDQGRVGIEPEAEFLSTAAAKAMVG